MNPLFQTYALNDEIELSNRIAMAPLTRCMADEDLAPTEASVDYYARRADSGLIISEAILISPDGQGYPNTPGLFTENQINAWRKVTDKVHQQDGKIFAQLWHTGRVAHPAFFDGDTVLAPSALGIEGSVPRMRHLTYTVPKPATKQDITRLVNDFKNAALNAIEAGFDGVEIHGANGYLIDQFLHHSSNIRTDEYGQTPENMSRFALDVVDATTEAIGAKRTALRIAPGVINKIKPDARDKAIFDYLLVELDKRQLAYLHVSTIDHNTEFDYLGGTAHQYVRARYKATLMCAGSYNSENGSAAITEDKLDLIAIGRPFIANPDFVQRVRAGDELVEYSEAMLTELT